MTATILPYNRRVCKLRVVRLFEPAAEMLTDDLIIRYEQKNSNSRKSVQRRFRNFTNVNSARSHRAHVKRPAQKLFPWTADRTNFSPCCRKTLCQICTKNVHLKWFRYSALPTYASKLFQIMKYVKWNIREPHRVTKIY